MIRHRLVSLLVAAVLLLLPLAVAANLHRGIEFSDTGYYHVSIAHLDQIDQQTTQFATAWNILPLPEDVVWHRVAVWLLLHGASAWLAVALWRLARPARPGGWPLEVLAGATGAAAATTFYVWWLPDPSYNSIGLALNLLLLALGLRAGELIQRDRFPRGAAVGVGSGLTALLLIRPPTAVGLALVVLVLVAARSRPSPAVLVRLIGWAVLGVIGFVLAAWALAEPPAETWARLQGGLERRQVLDRPGSFGDSIALWWDAAVASARGVGGAAALAVAGGIAVAHRASTRTGGLVGEGLAVIGLSLLGTRFVVEGGMTDAGVGMLADLTGLLAVAVLAGVAVAAVPLGLARGAPAPASSGAPRTGLVGVVVSCLLVAQVFQVVGTTNSWWTHAVLFHGIALLALGFAAVAGRAVLPVLTAGSLALLLLVGAASWTHLVNHPYRLPAGLDEQTIATPIRDGRTVLRTDVETHSLLTALAAGTDRLQGVERRPVLLDRTGRLPLVTYHLDMTAPGSPWLLSGTPGSQDLFDHVITQMPAAVLADAWVLDAPAWQERYDDDAFTTRGIELSTYAVVAEGWSNYLGTEVQLLAPPAG